MRVLLCFLLVFIATVDASAQDAGAVLEKDRRQQFFADFKKGDPFRLGGSFAVNLRSYGASGIENRQPPFIWFLSGQANLSIYRLNIPISALATAQSLTYSHPFHRDAFENRFTRIGASPYYKWVKLHLGHRNMNFSPLTVANHTFFGGGVELTPGRWRFASFYGRLSRTEPLDLSLRQPNREIFNRRGFGAKVGYGGSSNFIDLILFKAKDDPRAGFNRNLDSSFVFANENLVVGLNTQFKLLRNLQFSLELASSGFTQNTDDPESEIGPRLLQPGFLLPRRTSTIYRNALNSALQFQQKSLQLGLQYRRVDPGYRSLGAYFFNNDLENTTVNAGYGFWRNRLRVQGSAGLQRNNLDGARSNAFRRTIGSAGIGYAHQRLSVDLSYSNYTANVDYVLNLDEDSLTAVIVTQQASLNTSYVLGSNRSNDGGDPRQSLSLGLSAQTINDNVESLNNTADSRMLNALLGYRLTLPTPGWDVTARISYNQNELSRQTVDRYGLGGGVQKQLVAKKLTAGFDLNYFTSSGETVDFQTLNLRLNSQYQIAKPHRLDFSLLFLRRFGTASGPGASFREITGMLNYVYSFSISD